MWICFHLSSSTVWSSPSCCPPLPGSSGDRSRSLRRWGGAPWWAAPPASAPALTPRSAAARRPACRPGRRPWSSPSAWVRRSRPACSRASLSLPCTRADLHPHRRSDPLTWDLVVKTTRSDILYWSMLVATGGSSTGVIGNDLYDQCHLFSSAFYWSQCCVLIWRLFAHQYHAFLPIF